MFRTIVLLLSFVLLAACGSNNGNSAPSSDGRAPGIPATCKSIYDVWQSVTDSEQHDFTALTNEVVEQEYEFKGGDGFACGYASNPNHNLTAQLKIYTGNGGHQWQLTLVASLAMTGSCAIYTPPGSIGNRYSNALISMPACNELTICQPAGLGLCKTFR